MFMGRQGLGAALVFVVPDAQRLVVGTAHDELPAGVEHEAAHPVIMANLRRWENGGSESEFRARSQGCGHWSTFTARGFK